MASKPKTWEERNIFSLTLPAASDTMWCDALWEDPTRPLYSRLAHSRPIQAQAREAKTHGSASQRRLNAMRKQRYIPRMTTQYSKLHDIFPIQLLEPYYPRPEDDPLPMPELEDDPEEYKVEEVRGKQMIN